MANQTIGGFRFVKMRNGANRCPVEILTTADDYSTGLFRGDPIKRVSDGTIALAAATDALVIGIFDGCEYTDAQGIRRVSSYLPASTSFTALGAQDAPKCRVLLTKDAIFEVDGETATATTLAAHMAFVGENADSVATSAGSTVTGRSGYSLAIAGHSPVSGQFRILGVNTAPDNDPTVARFKYLVTVNESTDPGYTETGV